MASWTSPIYNRVEGDGNNAYNISDLNRVEENSQYLNDVLNSLGYASSVNTKYDWTMQDFFKETNGTLYLYNISSIRDVLTVPSSTPEVPSTLNNITRDIANDIEEIQYTIYSLIDGIEYQTNLNRADTYSSQAGESLGLI